MTNTVYERSLCLCYLKLLHYTSLPYFKSEKISKAYAKLLPHVRCHIIFKRWLLPTDLLPLAHYILLLWLYYDIWLCMISGGVACCVRFGVVSLELMRPLRRWNNLNVTAHTQYCSPPFTVLVGNYLNVYFKHLLKLLHFKVLIWC